MFHQHSLWLHMRLREVFVVTDPSSLPQDQSRRKRRGQSNEHPHGREKHLSSPRSLGDQRWGGEIPLWRIVDHRILSSHLPYRGGTPKSESCPEHRQAIDILFNGFSICFSPSKIQSIHLLPMPTMATGSWGSRCVDVMMDLELNFAREGIKC